MKHVATIDLELPSGVTVPLDVTTDLYRGSNPHDDPDDMDILGAKVSEDVVFNGITLFEKGQAFDFGRYMDEIWELVWKTV